MAESLSGWLGVLTDRRSAQPPVAEPEFCRELCAAAPHYGLKVIVFPPDGVQPDGRMVAGYAWQEGRWETVLAPAPDVLLNRCLRSGPGSGKTAALAALSGALPWSRGLPDKWGVYRLLSREPEAARLLPPTRRYSGPASLKAMLAGRGDGVFLKPADGSQGRGTLHIASAGGSGMRVRGRTGTNHSFEQRFDRAEDALRWVHAFAGTRRYIIQPYLHLTGRDGQPYDIRALVQKNGRGVWSLTGMAVRLGSSGSITSNLHGGGTAVSPLPFLLREFGGRGPELLSSIAADALMLPPLLEAACGRLGELGLDFGIDRSGSICLLEANSKPGRSAFRLTGDREASRLAVHNPLRYARYLLQQSGKTGSKITMVSKEDS
ncbi:YheC/YheD family protein [Paenibacillus sp. NFR01]|uniref:YheC/YheD family endospore coat-associated protein n=1 Tax=Paenibacillus sp. NFR01 TaxID=1566279 RepID=UPI0008CE49D6|nr:YheC/YheD family protein [Paenibacillus sp. NFR01]SES92890.1 YheC/D like ATP-grasp [Paenibacillus sp. NFR01]